MKVSSNKAIIPASELTSGWRVWQPDALPDPMQVVRGLSPAQVAALAALANGEPLPAAMPEETASADPADAGANAVLAELAEPEPPASQMGYPTAAELEAIHQDAWQAGHEAGYAAGLAEGMAAGAEAGHAEALAQASEQFRALWSPMQALSDAFSLQLAGLESDLASAVLALSVELAEKLVAARLEIDARAIEGLLREALASVPASVTEGRLRVNPLDLDAARTFLSLERPQTVWLWVEDPALPRGSCLLETPFSRQDLSLRTRIAALRAALGLPESADAAS